MYIYVYIYIYIHIYICVCATVLHLQICIHALSQATVLHRRIQIVACIEEYRLSLASKDTDSLTKPIGLPIGFQITQWTFVMFLDVSMRTWCFGDWSQMQTQCMCWAKERVQELITIICARCCDRQQQMRRQQQMAHDLLHFILEISILFELQYVTQTKARISTKCKFVNHNCPSVSIYIHLYD